MGLSSGPPGGRGGRYLFVYGTLRRGLRNPWARYLAEKARWLDQARLAGRLYDLGRYPGLRRSSKAADWVVGDLYRLPEEQDRWAEVLRALDEYEGEEFRRVRAVARRAGRPSVQTWVYEYVPSVLTRPRILSGDYLDRNADRDRL